MSNPYPHIEDSLHAEPRASPYAEEDGATSTAFPDELRPTLCPVNASDRRRAPKLPIPTGAAVPQPGSLDEILQTLTSSVYSVALLEYANWPVCCARPATVVSIESALVCDPRLAPLAESLPHFTEAEITDGWGMPANALAAALQSLDVPPPPRPRGLLAKIGLGKRTFRQGYDEQRQHYARHGSDGIALFQCRSCGRCYLGSHHVP